MRNRCYNPYYGRFYSEDPIWSTNLFPYADNNPINRIDPSGEYVQYIVGGIEIAAIYLSKYTNGLSRINQALYRGGNLTLKLKDVKINSINGLITTKNGISLYSTASKVLRFGRAYKIEYIPKGLKIIQKGKDLTHFEIVPTKEITFERFQSLLNQIIISLIK